MPNFTHGLDMNPLDWTIAIILAISTVTAFMRGLIRSLVSLIGLVAGIAIACWYASQGGAWLVRYIRPLALAQIVAFILILAAVYVVAVLIGRLLRGAASAVGLGFFDRLGGAMFGLVRGVLMLAALILPLAPWLPQFSATKRSILLPYLLPAAHGISFVMPRDFGMRVSAQRWLKHATAAAREITPIKTRTIPTD
jgi:membrane protein required for colicin V production